MFKKFIQHIFWHYHHYQDRAFDKHYALDTGQGDVSYLDEVSSENKNFAVAYEPVQVFMFRRMMKELVIPLSDYTFLDLGSGKGRALLLAQKYGFAQIIGVEFSPQLHKIAQANVKVFAKHAEGRCKVNLACQDAAEFQFPQQDLLLFLYNPFFGPAMQAVVKNIANFIADEPYDLVILYRNPQCSDLLDALPGLELVSAKESYKIYCRKARTPFGIPSE